MNDKYKFGISTTVDYTVSVFKLLDLFAQERFDFISFGADLKQIGFWDDARFIEVLKHAESLGLVIDSAHVPFGEDYNPSAGSADSRKSAVSKILKFIEHGFKHGITSMILHAHHYLDDNQEKVLNRAVRSLEEILKRKPEEVAIAVENLPDHRGSWICAELLKRFGPDEIGWCYDSSHENMSGPPFHLLREYYDRITVTHLSDNLGEHDDHFTPGEGMIDWNELADILSENRMLKRILFEVGTGDKLQGEVSELVANTRTQAEKYFG